MNIFKKSKINFVNNTKWNNNLLNITHIYKYFSFHAPERINQLDFLYSQLQVFILPLFTFQTVFLLLLLLLIGLLFSTCLCRKSVTQIWIKSKCYKRYSHTNKRTRTHTQTRRQTMKPNYVLFVYMCFSCVFSVFL